MNIPSWTFYSRPSESENVLMPRHRLQRSSETRDVQLDSANPKHGPLLVSLQPGNYRLGAGGVLQLPERRRPKRRIRLVVSVSGLAALFIFTAVNFVPQDAPKLKSHRAACSEGKTPSGRTLQESMLGGVIVRQIETKCGLYQVTLDEGSHAIVAVKKL